MGDDVRWLEKLLVRARSRDRAAFDRIHEEFEERVDRFAFRLVGLSFDVRDIVQRAFVSLWVNIGHIERAESILPYLFRIVRNMCYDELRRRRRFTHISICGEITECDIYATDPRRKDNDAPDVILEQADLLEKIAAAIDCLPEIHRHTMILYAEEDFSYEQIAETMKVDIGTVKSRIYHARKKLRATLGPEILREHGLKEK